MQTINMHEAKTHLSRLVDISVIGGEVVFARAGIFRVAMMRLLLDTHT